VNNDHTLTAIKDRLAEVRDSLGAAHPSIPAGEIMTRARRRRVRRRLIPGVSGVLALAAGAAVAVSVLLPASHPASHQPRVQLAAWTVTRQPGGIIHVTIRELHNPAGLQRKLRTDGVPASVTFAPSGLPNACQPYPQSPSLLGTIIRMHPGHSAVLVIDSPAIPGGAGLAIDVFPVSVGKQLDPAGIGAGTSLVRASQGCTGS
jgi:hypothetical protein